MEGGHALHTQLLTVRIGIGYDGNILIKKVKKCQKYFNFLSTKIVANSIAVQGKEKRLQISRINSVKNKLISPEPNRFIGFSGAIPPQGRSLVPVNWGLLAGGLWLGMVDNGGVSSVAGWLKSEGFIKN